MEPTFYNIPDSPSNRDNHHRTTIFPVIITRRSLPRIRARIHDCRSDSIRSILFSTAACRIFRAIPRQSITGISRGRRERPRLKFPRRRRRGTIRGTLRGPQAGGFAAESFVAAAEMHAADASRVKGSQYQSRIHYSNGSRRVSDLARRARPSRRGSDFSAALPGMFPAFDTAPSRAPTWLPFKRRLRFRRPAVTFRAENTGGRLDRRISGEVRPIRGS